VRSKPFAMTVAVVSALAGIIVMASASLAGPINPTQPYPNVPNNPDACKAKQILRSAQSVYDVRVKHYNRAMQGETTVTEDEKRRLRKEMNEAGIALNTAKYDLAKCQNNPARPANKDCVDLALELNRLLDELPLKEDLEKGAKEAVEAAKPLLARRAISLESYELLVLAATLATDQVELTKQLIADQRAAILAENCKDTERPAPKPSDKQPSLPPSAIPSPVTSTTVVPTMTIPSDTIN